MMKKTGCAALALLLLLLAAAGCAKKGSEPAAADTPSQADASSDAARVTAAVREVSKHGNLILDTTFEQLAAAGIEAGDLITVQLGDAAYDLPVGTSYTDVDGGEMLCRLDREDSEVGLVINMGSFAEATGAAVKLTIEEDPGYRWEIKCAEATLSLKEKKGYLDEYNARNLTRSDERADYPDLTDAEFANFRAVSAGALRENILYRSSSPLEPELGRNEYVLAEMERAGICTVLNLADSAEDMQGFAAYPGSFYSGCAVVNPEMNYDFTGTQFAEKVKTCVEFMIGNDGPYLVHCKEGKDRTGIFCALLECFAGAAAQEVERDYMLTYRNYYGVTPDDTAYGILLEHNLVKTLCALFGVDTLEGTDLKEAAARYLHSAGLDDAQLDRLAEKLIAA